MRFSDRNALITGGAGDLGMGIARRLLAEGARVSLTGRDAQRLAEAVASLGTERVAAFVADVSDAAAVAASVRGAVGRFGPLDVFVNNAGIEGALAPVNDYPEEEFDRVMRVNVRGVFLGMKYVAPAMRDGGSIIIMSSVAGLAGGGGMIGYTTSKHAEIGIMRDSAHDLAPRGIRVNTVHPGFVDSSMLLRILRRMSPGVADAELRAQAAAAGKLGHCVTVEDVAAMVAFLASDEARSVTGQTMVVDAGILL